MNQDPKTIALEFLRMVVSGHVREAYGKYVGAGFRHHNAYFPGDAESLMVAMEANNQEHPNKVLDVRRALRDGDFVAIADERFARAGASVRDS